jgi:hypothetical protein
MTGLHMCRSYSGATLCLWFVVMHGHFFGGSRGERPGNPPDASERAEVECWERWVGNGNSPARRSW